MELPSKITIGDKYGPAMEITDQAEAIEYFEACVRHCMGHGKDRAEAEKIERSNLGYYSGYYDGETAQRVFRLFNCSHPIFGTSLSRPTAQEAFDAGKKLATNPHPAE